MADKFKLGSPQPVHHQSPLGKVGGASRPPERSAAPEPPGREEDTVSFSAEARAEIQFGIPNRGPRPRPRPIDTTPTPEGPPLTVEEMVAKLKEQIEAQRAMMREREQAGRGHVNRF